MLRAVGISGTGPKASSKAVRGRADPTPGKRDLQTRVDESQCCQSRPNNQNGMRLNHITQVHHKVEHQDQESEVTHKRGTINGIPDPVAQPNDGVDGNAVPN